MLKIKRGVCVLLVFAVAFILFGCSNKNKADAVVVKPVEIKQDVGSANKSKSIYISNRKRSELKKISSSDITVMYFDETNYSVSVYDSISKKLWNSLPESYTNEKPATVSVDVIINGIVYTLNSQDDSVANKAANYEIKDNSLIVTYDFKKTLNDGTKISFNIPVKYSVDSGALTVSVDCSKIRNNDMSENAIIKTVYLLDYFGANVSSKSGDYIFLPDGCGAKIDINKKVDEFKKISLPVYGADYSAGESDSSSLARVASFGMKSGDSAYVALIESGDAIAKIVAEKAINKSAYNRIGASFDITKVMTNKNDKIIYAAENSYDGEIKISYRLLSGDNSDYVGMASACREMLIRNGTLNFSGTFQNSDNMPFALNLVGAAELGDEKTKLTSLTTFEQAVDILSVLRGKGISNISLRYKGVLDGGLRQNDVTKTGVSSLLGSNDQFEELIRYTDSQNIVLFADMNLISAKDGSLKKTATRLDSSLSAKTFSDLSGSVTVSKGSREFLAVNEIEKTTNAMLSKMRSLEFDGICLSDAGNVLYSDFSHENTATRQQMKTTLTNQINAVSSNKKLMIDGGNMYSVKYADTVVNLPDSAACATRDDCESIPFLQALLHGVVNYSSKPINLTSNPETAMLKAAEFGCIPSFEFYYEDFGTDKKVDNHYYMNYATDAQLCYDRMNSVLATLADKKITSHYRVKSGVYCTEYGGSTSVYVNYNKNDVTVGGVTIEARDFLRVN